MEKNKENNAKTKKEKTKIKISKKSKIMIAIIALVIIVGLAITLTIGLNFDLRYQDAKAIDIYISKDFEKSDIKQITDEVLSGEKVIIQKVEVFEDTVRITAKEITEEQKQNVINKVNEKYGAEISADDIQIETVPNTRGRDIIKPYLAPFTIATIIILIYMAIRYRKLGVVKILLKTVGILVVAEILLLSIMAITRIPIGIVTIPLVITIYLLTLIGLTTYFENKLLNKNNEENKK